MLSNLPQDIINNILSYNENVKYRNGKYMFQILKDDKRYKILDHLFKNIELITYYPDWTIVRIHKPIYHKTPHYRFKIYHPKDQDKVYYCYFNLFTQYIRK